MRSVERMLLPSTKQAKDKQSLFHRQIHIAERLVLQLCEGLAASVTAEALITFAVFADFDGDDLAVVTGHCEPLLSKAIRSQCRCLGWK
jgi:hypothetical protein